MSDSIDEPGRPSAFTVTGTGGRREITYAHWMLGECKHGVSLGTVCGPCLELLRELRSRHKRSGFTV